MSNHLKLSIFGSTRVDGIWCYYNWINFNISWEINKCMNLINYGYINKLNNIYLAQILALRTSPIIEKS